MKITVTTIVSMVLALLVFLFGVLYVTNVIRLGQLPELIEVFNLPSFSIIVGGVFAHVLISFPPEQLFSSLSRMSLFFAHSKNDTARMEEIIPGIIQWQRELRKNKLAAAAGLSEDVDDHFASFLFTLMATNYSTEDIKELGEARITSNFKKNSSESNIYTALGNASPAFGMLGTLLGLIVMLQDFQDSGTLGMGLGVALMTTLYGLSLAQFLWFPMEKKIINAARQAARREQLMLDGILLIMQDKPSMYIKDYLSASIQ
ncbi:MAG: MotA/TolQ/ExbB proton channel family protein [Bacteroidales bacterium]|nr:MotA/TolQ/ExbB proton channel family protein [Bacteroidales bacterium]